MMKISVVTVTYNAGEVLQATIDSVMEQGYDNVEHIIIDGASTDETMAMSREYARRLKAVGSPYEVVIQSEPDSGLYYAMNKGLFRATGDYVVFLNAGDRFASPDTLTIVAEAAGSDVKTGVVYGDTVIVDIDNNILRPRHKDAPEKLSWRSFKDGMVVCHQAFFALREIAKVVPYDTDYRYSADVDWCIRVMKAAEDRGMSLVNTHSVLCHFLDNGMSQKHKGKSLRERYSIMSDHYGTLSAVSSHLSFLRQRV